MSNKKTVALKGIYFPVVPVLAFTRFFARACMVEVLASLNGRLENAEASKQEEIKGVY